MHPEDTAPAALLDEEADPDFYREEARLAESNAIRDYGLIEDANY